MIKAIRTAFMTVALSFVTAMSFNASAQNTNVRVSGNVVDESGTPLSGVVVYVKSGNTKDATVTDGNGAYSIGASSASSLVYSCLGYKEQEILVGSQSVINVKLVLDSFNLDDAVVIGYGSQKMKDLTGGLSVVNRETLEMVSTGNLMDRISGQVHHFKRSTGFQPVASYPWSELIVSYQQPSHCPGRHSLRGRTCRH